MHALVFYARILGQTFGYETKGSNMQWGDNSAVVNEVKYDSYRKAMPAERRKKDEEDQQSHS